MEWCLRKTLTFQINSLIKYSLNFSFLKMLFSPLLLSVFEKDKIVFLLSDMTHSWIKDTTCKWEVSVLYVNSGFTAMSFTFFFWLPVSCLSNGDQSPQDHLQDYLCCSNLCEISNTLKMHMITKSWRGDRGLWGFLTKLMKVVKHSSGFSWFSLIFLLHFRIKQSSHFTWPIRILNEPKYLILLIRL